MRLPPSHSNGLKNLSVGCGPHHLRESFWNTDLRGFDGIDETFDAAKPWPYIGILEHIYAEHFLEHLRIDQAIEFLVHAGLSLAKGGHIRLSTPSLEWVLSTHFNFEGPTEEARIEDTITTNRAFHGWGHQFLYSKPFIYKLLKDIGYDDIEFCDYGKSAKPTFVGIEQHGGYSIRNGFPSVWIVEATRNTGFISKPLKFYEKIEHDYLRHVLAGH